MKSFLLAICFSACTLFVLAQEGSTQCSQSKILRNTRVFQKKLMTPQVAVTFMDLYDVKFHHLNLNVERTSTALSGSVRTLVQLTANRMDTLVFQLHDVLTVDSVLGFKKQKLNFSRGNHLINIIPDSQYTKGNVIDVTIFYHGIPPSGASAAIGNGFNNKTAQPTGNQITWSLSESYSAYEWWPCKQALPDKIDSSWVFIMTDTSNLAGSNGILTNVVTLGNGKKRCEWKSRIPIDYYLISVAVGQYFEFDHYAHPQQTKDSVLIQHYLYNSTVFNSNKTNVLLTKDLIELYSKLFGLYPFYKEKYGHCMGPIGGGMEHQTMTTLSSLNFSLIAHELGHQWFGDNITCGTWHDIWLNEGFATYCEYLAYQGISPGSGNDVAKLASIHSDAKAISGTVWVDDTTDVPRIFDANLSYAKGAAVLHMIRYLTGDTVFFAWLQAYQTAFGKGIATTADLQKSLENYTGKSWTNFFNQWIYGNGFPNFTITWNYQAGFFHLNTYQNNVYDPNNVFTLALPYVVTTAKGDTTLNLSINGKGQYYKLPFKDSIISLQFDPNNWILCNANVAKDAGLLGVQDHQLAEKLAVFPNPAKRNVSFKGGSQTQYAYKILDMKGSQLLSGMAMVGEDINTENLHIGIYLMIIEAENGSSQVFKLMIE